MGPHWHFAAEEACAESHNPDEWDGREWEELTDDEKATAVEDYLFGLADSMEPM